MELSGEEGTKVVCEWNTTSKYNTKHVVSAARPLKNLNFRVFSDPFLFPLFVRAVFTPPFLLARKPAVLFEHLFLSEAAALCEVAGARELVLPRGTIRVIFF